MTGLSGSNQQQGPFVSSRPSNIAQQTEAPVYVATPTPAFVAPQTTRRPVQETSTSNQKPDDTSSDPNRFDKDFDCGVPDYQAPTTTGLVLGGKVANRGQFPWLENSFHL